jgi:hypothetical protein
MKRLIFILGVLFLFALSNAQEIGRFPFTSANVAGDAYGSEMITDGDFPDATNWTEGANWSISSGVATYDDLGNSALSQVDGDMQSSIAISTDYRITFDITLSGGDAAYFGIYNSTQGTAYVAFAEYGAGSHVVDFTTPGSIGPGGIAILANTAGGGFTIDNISLKEEL